MQIGEFEVIRNNIDRWTYKYVPPENRLLRIEGGGTATRQNKPPVHLNVTLEEIVTHNCSIDAIGMYQGVDNDVLWPVYSADKPVWTSRFDGSAWSAAFDGKNVPYDNLFAQKNLMESLGSVDDIVAQCGAVLYGWDPDDWPRTRVAESYSDKAGWLTGAILEELLGNSWYNLARQQFDMLGLSAACHPSYGGQAYFYRDGQEVDARYRLLFRGHNSLPLEIKNLAVAYNLGPANADGTGQQAYLEPYQAPESGYAIGCAVLTAADLARWAYNLRTGVLGQDAQGYLSAEMIDKMFSIQSGADDLEGVEDYPWPRTNWGFGAERMYPLTDRGGNAIDTWGSVGQGGFGGYGGAVLWLDGGETVFAITTNSGLRVNTLYAIAKDYAANFHDSPGG
jgi:hypothetical protein